MHTFCFVDECGNVQAKSLMFHMRGGGALSILDGGIINVVFEGVRVNLLLMEPVQSSLDDTQRNTLC